jgi:hypothetical protein
LKTGIALIVLLLDNRQCRRKKDSKPTAIESCNHDPREKENKARPMIVSGEFSARWGRTRWLEGEGG